MRTRHTGHALLDGQPDRHGVDAYGLARDAGDVHTGAVLLFDDRLEGGRELESALVVDLGGIASAKHIYSNLLQKTPRRG